jgi:hypothetical protein
MKPVPTAEQLAPLLTAWYRQFGTAWTPVSAVVKRHRELVARRDGGKLESPLSTALRGLGCTSLKALSQALSRSLDTVVPAFALRRQWDSDTKRWLFSVERAKGHLGPAPARKPLKPRRQRSTNALEPMVVDIGEQTPAESETEVERIYQPERPWIPREVIESPAPPVISQSDTEVWTGPHADRAEAERAAALIRRCGVGCAAVVIEDAGLIYARSVGAQNSQRTAATLYLAERLRSARVGMHGAAPIRSAPIQGAGNPARDLPIEDAHRTPPVRRSWSPFD